MVLSLVTGAAGFIGSHLTKQLLDDGHHVIGIDNLSSGQLSNITPLLDNQNFSFIKADVATNLLLDQKFDFIWHLACPASPPRYQEDPLQTIATCYQGTLNMLELAHKTNATILLASTSEIYGQPLVHPQEESYFGNVNTLGPRACYDEGKRIAETLAFNYWMQKQVNIKIARIFNTYGPNMRLDDGRVITNFIGQLLNGKPLTIYGDGLTTRSFCYVSDTVNALRLIMTSEGEYLYNVGNPQEISLLTLVDELERLTNSTGRSIHWLDKPQDDPVRRKPDISKIYSKLGWKPKIDLHDGLKQTIDYFQQCNSKPTGIPSPMKAAV